jgi:hypothetical protein
MHMEKEGGLWGTGASPGGQEGEGNAKCVSKSEPVIRDTDQPSDGKVGWHQGGMGELNLAALPQKSGSNPTPGLVL